jgi:hypothetical protein
MGGTGHGGEGGRRWGKMTRRSGRCKKGSDVWIEGTTGHLSCSRSPHFRKWSLDARSKRHPVVPSTSHRPGKEREEEVLLTRAVRDSPTTPPDLTGQKGRVGKEEFVRRPQLG